MNLTHKQICDAVVQYLRENRKFTNKHNKAAGVRARNALHDLSVLVKDRRKQLLNERKSLPLKKVK